MFGYNIIEKLSKKEWLSVDNRNKLIILFLWRNIKWKRDQ